MLEKLETNVLHKTENMIAHDGTLRKKSAVFSKKCQIQCNLECNLVTIVVLYFEVIRTILGLFILFFTKSFWAQKSTKTQNKRFLPFRSLSEREKLLLLLFFVRLLLFCWLIFACDVFFKAQNLFAKKSNNQAWNCPDNLKILYYWRVTLSTTLCGIIILLMASIIFIILTYFLSVRFYFHSHILTCVHSFWSVRILITCENSI